ncbi:MAG: DUF6787 family protein [Dehalococcoidia bacterium]
MGTTTDSRRSREALHYVVVILVFGITGTLAVLLSKVLLNEAFGLDGSLVAGPWSFRVAYVLLIPPSYSVMLVIVGSLLGKREFFLKRVLRMWGFLPPVRWIVRATRLGQAARHRDR